MINQFVEFQKMNSENADSCNVDSEIMVSENENVESPDKKYIF